jgi:hypothetical protein
MRVLPCWPDDRYLELAPKHWRATRAKLSPLELEMPISGFEIPPVDSSGSLAYRVVAAVRAVAAPTLKVGSAQRLPFSPSLPSNLSKGSDPEHTTRLTRR